MTIKYKRQAKTDLRKIILHGAQQGFPNSTGYAIQLMTSISVIGTHPKVGRTGRVTGTRELVIAGTPYIAVYSVKGQHQYVLRVLHGAQLWP